MPNDEEIRAGAVALGKTYAPKTRWEAWSPEGRAFLEVQSRAVLEAAEKARK